MVERKSGRKTPQNDKKEIVRPRVEVSPYQYERLKKLKEKTGKPLSWIIQEAVFHFVRKKDYLISIAVSYLPKGTRDNCKSVAACFPKPDWNLLIRISENTGRWKNDLIREAVREYLRESP